MALLTYQNITNTGCSSQSRGNRANELGNSLKDSLRSFIGPLSRRDQALHDICKEFIQISAQPTVKLVKLNVPFGQEHRRYVCMSYHVILVTLP
jgi:hypothetical protein